MGKDELNWYKNDILNFSYVYGVVLIDKPFNDVKKDINQLFWNERENSYVSGIC